MPPGEPKEKPTKPNPTAKKSGKVSKGRKILENAQDDYKFLLEESVSFDSRIVQLSGIIGDGVTFEFVDAAITSLESISNEPIILKILSNGGNVYEALAIVGRISASPAPIITEGYGAVMSAATMILACGDHRCMSKYAMFMHHESSYGTGGSHSDNKEAVEQMEREEQLWSEWMEKFSNRPAKEWRSKAKKRSWYLTAEQCMKYKIVDEVF